MRAAVFGATGFIGRALVRALADRTDVLAVSRRGDAKEAPNVRPAAADAADATAVRDVLHGVDVV